MLMRALITLLAVFVFVSPVLAQDDTDQVDKAVKEETVKNVISKVKKGVIRVQSISVSSPIISGNAGGGSGFVFDVDYDQGIAYALTNYHVSGDSMLNGVKFWDEAEYKAELVASEPGIDVALLRILGIPDERDIPEDERTIVPCVLGDSDQTQIGELAIAMGNPGANESFKIDYSNPLEDFLLHQTATVNVITGRDTPIEFEIGIWGRYKGEMAYQYGTNFDYAFRMSTPINGGNSGGPLFNADGEVIGINFFGGSFALTQNSNHAIPINLAKDFAFQILETGKFEKPWLGMDIIMPPWVRSGEQYTEFVERYRPDHIEIYNVRTGSPAESAGFRQGDVIMTVDGQEFKDAEAIRLYIFSLDIGTPVTFQIKRMDQVTKKLKALKDPIVVQVAPKRTYNSEFSV